MCVCVCSHAFVCTYVHTCGQVGRDSERSWETLEQCQEGKGK